MRTVEAIVKFFLSAQQLASDKIYVFATSAVRDASNKDLFISEVKNSLGITPEILSGEEEARLSFLGAASAFPKEVLKEAS